MRVSFESGVFDAVVQSWSEEVLLVKGTADKRTWTERISWADVRWRVAKHDEPFLFVKEEVVEDLIEHHALNRKLEQIKEESVETPGPVAAQHAHAEAQHEPADSRGDAITDDARAPKCRRVELGIKRSEGRTRAQLKSWQDAHEAGDPLVDLGAKFNQCGGSALAVKGGKVRFITLKESRNELPIDLNQPLVLHKCDGTQNRPNLRLLAEQNDGIPIFVEPPMEKPAPGGAIIHYFGHWRLSRQAPVSFRTYSVTRPDGSRDNCCGTATFEFDHFDVAMAGAIAKV